MRIRLVGLVVLVSALTVITCARTPTTPTESQTSAPSAQPQPSGSVSVRFDPDTQQFRATFSDGREVSDVATYTTIVESALAQQADFTGSISIGPVDVDQKPAWDIKGPIPGSKFYFRVSGESGWVRSCINRFLPHAGLMLKDVSVKPEREIVNLHIASWKDNGKICAGVYNSANGWCRSTCSPSKTQLKNMIATALIAAGIGAGAAAIIADISLPFVLVFVAL